MTKSIAEAPHIEILSESIPVSMTDNWFEIATKDHFWIEWRFEVLKKYKSLLPAEGSSIFEIGCGNGLVLEQLNTFFKYKVVGCDLNTLALKMTSADIGRILLYNIFDKNPDLLGKFSAIFLMDVLEHITDDINFLKTSTEYLQPGGTVVINVPALMSLYSKYDKEAGHIRRHTKKSIKELLLNAGIEPIKIFYWGFSLVPVALARKAVLKLTPDEQVIKKGFAPPGKFTHSLFKILKNIETSLISSCPIGTSVMAIGRKK